MGKTLILKSDTSSLDLRFNTCSYAVAPKNNVDYALDGRLIHDGSFPPGSSVNDAVPSTKLDAGTDDVKDIARRVLYLYQTFPGTPIYGMAADVDSAFQNAYAHEISAKPPPSSIRLDVHTTTRTPCQLGPKIRKY